MSETLLHLTKHLILVVNGSREYENDSAVNYG